MKPKTSFVRTLTRYLSDRRNYDYLRDADDHILRDIGLIRHDVERVRTRFRL